MPRRPKKRDGTPMLTPAEFRVAASIREKTVLHPEVTPEMLWRVSKETGVRRDWISEMLRRPDFVAVLGLDESKAGPYCYGVVRQQPGL